MKIAVIGVGSITRRGYLPVMGNRQDVEISVVYSRSKNSLDKVTRQYNVKNATTDFQEVVQQPGLDCAFILTPCKTHAEFSIPFLEKGVDVFCEKPMAWTLSECEKMVNIAEKNKRILMIGFNRRYSPPMQYAKEVFSKTPPQLCVIERSKTSGRHRIAAEDIVHNLDLMRYYCGEPREVTAVARGKNIGDGHENCLTAHVVFDSDAVGIATVSYAAGTWQEYISLTGDGKTLTIQAPDRLTYWNAQGENKVIDYTKDSGSWAIPAELKGFEKEITEFFESVKTRKKPLTCGEDSLKSMYFLAEVCKCAGMIPL